MLIKTRYAGEALTIALERQQRFYEDITRITTMHGERLADRSDPFTFGTPPSGAYWIGEDGRWYVMTPNGLLGCLANHDVKEHEDRTITVTPSILVRGHGRGYHGFLERGTWRPA